MGWASHVRRPKLETQRLPSSEEWATEYTWPKASQAIGRCETMGQRKIIIGREQRRNERHFKTLAGVWDCFVV